MYSTWLKRVLLLIRLTAVNKHYHRYGQSNRCVTDSLTVCQFGIVLREKWGDIHTEALLVCLKSIKVLDSFQLPAQASNTNSKRFRHALTWSSIQRYGFSCLNCTINIDELILLLRSLRLRLLIKTTAVNKKNPKKLDLPGHCDFSATNTN